MLGIDIGIELRILMRMVLTLVSQNKLRNLKPCQVIELRGGGMPKQMGMQFFPEFQFLGDIIKD